MVLRFMFGLLAIILLLDVFSGGLTRTPTYAFWKSSKSFSFGLVCYSENVLVNLGAFRDRSAASLKAYRERLGADTNHSMDADDVLTRMIATDVFSQSCLEIATNQNATYNGFLKKTFVFRNLLTPMPEPDSNLSLGRGRE